MEMTTDNLNGFRTHGVEFYRIVGEQAVGHCPFCEKENHFYANKETRLWDCKRCGESGNFEDFLGKIAALYVDQLSEERLRLLAKDRGIPAVAFRPWNFGFNGDRYSLPIQNSKGRTVDIRMFRAGGKILSTPTAGTGLFNIRELVLPENLRLPVWICEGEWDAVAWHWLLRRLAIRAVVVGVPGAGTFKDTWVPFLQDREVGVLYDNDLAGSKGANKVLKKLTGTAKNLKFLHWPEGFGDGYDIRDLAKEVYADKRTDQQAYQEVVVSNLRPEPPPLQLEEDDDVITLGHKSDREPIRTAPEILEPISTADLVRTYKKWLHMASTDALKVMFGVVLANKLEGDPIWLFLVAPPGGSKSELLMSLSKSAEAHAISSLTPHTLISGASWKEGQDPSLLPQLKDKVLIIKDFTTLLTLHYSVRDEIFGTLRDVYDGQTEKVFGNGIRRRYNVHFGILAGVTPAIETFNVMHQGLGERFLKFRISGNWDQISEEDKILRALNNIGHENAMRSELQEAATRWLANASLPDPIPLISEEFKMSLVHLAKFSARMRGVVERDKFSQQVLYKPSSEVGTRIAKQLAKLGQGIAMFLEKRTLDEEVYTIVRRIALDTVPDRVEDIVRALWMTHFDNPGSTCRTADVVFRTRLPQTTVFRCLEDMKLLRLVESVSDKGPAQWRLSAKILEHIQKARVYELEEVKKKPAKPKGMAVRLTIKR